MSVKITGMAELESNFKKFLINTDVAVDRAVRKQALITERAAVLLIKTPSVGTYVTRYTAGGQAYSHVASKKGDAPNSDTGRLVGSMNILSIKGEQTAYVFTNLDYGNYLETTMNRPFLEPAKEQEKDKFAGFVTAEINKIIEAI